MDDRLMYIPSDDTQNYPFCRIKLVVAMLEHPKLWINQPKFTKVPKVVEPTNKKRYYKTLGISVIISMDPKG